MTKRYRENHLGRFTTKAANEADPDGVTAESVRPPDDWSVSDEMADAALATYRDWLSGDQRYATAHEAIRAIIDSALAVKREAA